MRFAVVVVAGVALQISAVHYTNMARSTQTTSRFFLMYHVGRLQAKKL